jgi:hypothetical protein
MTDQKSETGREAQERINMASLIINKLTSGKVDGHNAKDLELSMQSIVMETQRAILNELILIREKLESEPEL